MSEKAPQPKKYPDSIPFEGLSETNLSMHIHKLKKNPHLLVREWPIQDEGFSREEVIEKFKRGINIFKALQEKYEVAVPRMDLVIGRMRGKETMFTVTDRIYGESLDKIMKLPEEAYEKADMLFSGLAEQYFDVLREGGDYWDDFHLGQVIYGHKHDETENKMYIVDVEPYFREYQPASEAKAWRLFGTIYYFFKGMAVLEKIFEPPRQFKEARKIFQEIVQFVPSENEDYANYILPIKNALEKDTIKN